MGVQSKGLSVKVNNVLQACGYPLIAIAIALLLGGITIGMLGFDALYSYQCLIKGSLGSLNAIGETINKAIPVIFTGLSYAIAKRCGLINLGAEGQLYIGALTGTLVGSSLEGLPFAVHLPLTLLAGFLGGAIYGMIFVGLKIKFGASELITTIMLNYIAINFVSYCISGPMMDPSVSNSFPQSKPILATAQLPKLLKGTRLHAGIFVVIACLIFYAFFMWHTTKGYEMRVIGLNAAAAQYAGMNLKFNSLLSMFIAGGMAGLGGCIEIISVQLRLMEGFSSNYGFDGIAVALLGGGNPIGIAISGLLFGALRSGSGKMEMLARVPSAVIYMIQGFIILCVVGREMIGFLHLKKNGHRSTKIVLSDL